jgi:DNA polymerase elongation subunit (family B)
MLSSETDPLLFQIKDIVARDVYTAPERGSDDEAPPSEPGWAPEDPFANRTYEMMLFGTQATGASVSLRITGFRPFFYIRIPDALTAHEDAKRRFLAWVNQFVPESVAAGTTLSYTDSAVLFDFNGTRTGTFLKLETPCQALLRSLKDRFLTDASTPKYHKIRNLFGDAAVSLLTAAKSNDVSDVKAGTVALKVYEANLDPMLRFFHIQGVNPAGWVRVDPASWDVDELDDSKVLLKAVAAHTDVKPYEPERTAPFLVASWDIECMSSHGDFPLAAKTYRKPLQELKELGWPKTLEDLCAIVAEAMNAAMTKGSPSRLSPIYLKPRRPILAETLLGAFVQISVEGDEPSCANREAATAALSALREGGGTTVTTNLFSEGFRDDSESEDEESDGLARLDAILSRVWPALEGDEIIQIGTVLYKQGAPVSKHIWVNGTVDAGTVAPPGATVPIYTYPCRTETAMLTSWFRWIAQTNPDVLIGYNVFGFDSKYVWNRLEQCVGSKETIKIASALSCLKKRPSRLDKKELSSAAMGDNTMYIISSPGRLQIDLLPYIRRNHNLDSYTLDNVSATFVSGPVKGVKQTTATTVQFQTKSTKGLVAGRYVALMDDENDRILDRALVLAVEDKTVSIQATEAEMAEHGAKPTRWAQVKDDVSPKDIFRLHGGSAEDRAIIARYCLQDCDLVMELFHKLEVLTNSLAMADVCTVPVSFIFLRGQGVKIESLIFRECRNAGQLIEVLPSPPRAKDTDSDSDKHEKGVEKDVEKPVDDTYEGAIVLDPRTGIFIDDPVSADDFSSLYPSSIISENISHNTLISVKLYDKAGVFVRTEKGSDEFDGLPGAKYVDIQYDVLHAKPGDKRKHPEKFPDGFKVVRYIQSIGGKPVKGTIPLILQMLLAKRKEKRKEAEKEPDEFKKALLDAQQLAYKLTANSLYGQLGSGTFKVRCQELAASTTAYGRKQLMFAKKVIEEVYGPGKDPRCDAEVVYGDTDSLFLRFRPKDPTTGVRLSGKAALQAAKDLTVESGQLVTSCLKPPHDFEFDKIFRTFCLLSKKRYVGDMSEDGVEEDDFHRKSMGIVMKRRDNAPIVKYVYGGVVDRILDPKQTDRVKGIRDAAQFVKDTVSQLLRGEFPIHKLTITKSLRAAYADPTRIAHKVLADRIAVRDPGNKPSTSDRIPFVYIQTKEPKPKLQGDRIETPAFIKAHGLQPDYAFYITNQIAKPVAQVFGLVVADLPGVSGAQVRAASAKADPVKAKEALAEDWLFHSVMRDAARTPEAMKAKGQRSIATFFTKSNVLTHV